MRSQYSPPATRWVLAAAALAYVLAMVVAPAQHFAEEGSELSAFLADIQHAAHGSELDQRSPEDSPAPFPDHGPEELDCLFCQVLSAPANPAGGDLASVASFAAGPDAPVATHPAPAAPFRANGARAPPLPYLIELTGAGVSGVVGCG